MRRLAFRLHTMGGVVLVLVASALTSAEVVGDPDRPPTTVIVRVYQTAGLPLNVEDRVLSETEKVLRSAQVDVQWRRCTGQDTSTTCNALPEASELLLRMVGRATGRRKNLGSLGDALLTSRKGCGVLATAYVDDVLNVAEQARTDFGLLLGRVAAHELGHLLMRTTEHARHGLMRAHWTLDEIRRNSAAEWEFTVADIAAMRDAGTPVEGALRFTASPAGCL